MRLVFLGPPGAGKGTQAKRICEAYGLRHASTGDIFRQAVQEQNELGRSVKQYLDSGKLVPDDLTSRVVEQMVVSRWSDFLLDGYPRTLPQAEDLAEMLQRRGKDLDAVLYFELDDETCVRRLTGRLVCSQCGANYHREFMPPKHDEVCDRCGGELTVRSDSSEQVVRERLSEYQQKTQPLVDYYGQRSLLKEVDASNSPDAVTADTRRILDNLHS